MRTHPLLALATAATTASAAFVGHLPTSRPSLSAAVPKRTVTRSVHIVDPFQAELTAVFSDVGFARRARKPATVHPHLAHATVSHAAHPFVPLGGVWAELRNCESGGDYQRDSGNGYYGAYQFSLSTWSSLGNTGLPSSAAPALQDASAERLQARAGWGSWPNCSYVLGLR